MEKFKVKDYYREKIIEIVKKLDNEEWLRFLYKIVQNLAK